MLYVPLLFYLFDRMAERSSAGKEEMISGEKIPDEASLPEVPPDEKPKGD
jgi:hypothetical protein